MEQLFIYKIPRKVLDKLKQDYSAHMLDYQIDLFRVRIECIAGEEFWGKLKLTE